MCAKTKLSKTSLLHYIKLILRSFIFLLATAFYILKRTNDFSNGFSVLALFVWIIYIVEMCLRFIPSNIESRGCQKQFKHNYKPTGQSSIKEEHQWWRTAIVLGFWCLLNGVIAALYYLGIIDKGIMILISLAYSVCDIICILFFCPFQSWMLKNKCCGSCRIYNWDYSMMFTPLIFINSLYGWSLFGISFLLLLRWEITYRFYPERFYPSTNEFLQCANCQEKLCTHKKQLKTLWKHEAQRLKKLKEKIYNQNNTKNHD
jgi:hypothetical protein